MNERISEIWEGYRDTVKPLLEDIKVRRGNYNLPNNFLNEIRALNDHIARCYRKDIKKDDINSELTKAEGHLRRLVYDCFKQLNIYISDELIRKEKLFYSDLWLFHDKGKFWEHYSDYRKSAQNNVIEAKKNESIDSDIAMSFYEQAFINYRNAEELLINNKKMLYKSFFVKWSLKIRSFASWLIITVILSFIGALIGFLW